MKQVLRILVLALATCTLAAPSFAGFSGTDLMLPSVGKGPGASLSQWNTTVWISNPTAVTANVQVMFLERKQPNSSPVTTTVSVPAGDTVRYANAISDLFGFERFGALRFVSDQKVIVSCRIYNSPAGGADRDTQGQDYAGIPASFGIAKGQSTQLLGVYQTSTDKSVSPFRYSFGLAESAGGTASVHIKAFDETGAVVAEKDFGPFGAYEVWYYSVEDLSPALSSTNLRLQVSMTDGTGKIIAVGSGVANQSNDGTTFEMQFADSLLGGGTGGLSAVSHDATLIGDGSTGSPLGIANGAVTKARLSASGGTNGQVLGTDGTNLQWVNPPALSLPYAGSASTAAGTDLFALTNTGGGRGLHVITNSDTALWAISNSSTGVDARSTSGPGLSAASGSADGVVGWTGGSGRSGVYGYTNTSADFGVTGRNLGTASMGYLGGNTIGVYGQASAIGVQGAASGGSGMAVSGVGSGGADGVNGSSDSGYGIEGSTASGTAAIYGHGPGNAIYGASGGGSSWAGVFGNSTGTGIGVSGLSSGVGKGVQGWNTDASGYAGYFNGKVQVTGTLSKGGGSFKIDHPLDPENKYLYHSFVESPDMKNIYDGTVTTDANGDAAIELPAWFEALNRDFRYQLTVIGEFAQAIVAREVANNSFAIRTSKPNVKVSWQVTGIRQDPFANKYRIAVEEDKPAAERGSYLHPDAYGQPQERGVAWTTAPAWLRKGVQETKQPK